MIQDMIDGWYKQYVQSKSRVITFKYGVFRSDWMGKTSFSNPLRIEAQKVFTDHNIWTRVVAWHEFCHCWAYLDAGHRDHGWPFFVRIIRKPLMFLAQVPCCFVYVFLRLFGSNSF